MSKLACPCGNILSDSAQQDAEDNWGIMISNGQKWDLIEKIAQTMEQFCIEYKNSNHIEWLEKNCPVYTDQQLQPIISDILTRLSLDTGIPYGKCPECGSLLIEKSKEENIYYPYRPQANEKSEQKRKKPATLEN